MGDSCKTVKVFDPPEILPPPYIRAALVIRPAGHSSKLGWRGSQGQGWGEDGGDCLGRRKQPPWIANSTNNPPRWSRPDVTRPGQRVSPSNVGPSHTPALNVLTAGHGTSQCIHVLQVCLFAACHESFGTPRWPSEMLIITRAASLNLYRRPRAAVVSAARQCPCQGGRVAACRACRPR